MHHIASKYIHRLSTLWIDYFTRLANDCQTTRFNLNCDLRRLAMRQSAQLRRRLAETCALSPTALVAKGSRLNFGWTIGSGQDTDRVAVVVQRLDTEYGLGLPSGGGTMDVEHPIDPRMIGRRGVQEKVLADCFPERPFRGEPAAA